MSGLAPGAAMAALVVIAFLLARLPRPLFTQAAGRPPSRTERAGLFVALAAVGLVGFCASLGDTIEGRATFAGAMMALAGVIYADLSFLIIPDLYSAMILILALVSPWRAPLGQAALGLAVCGGLLAVVAYVWRRINKTDGLGFGDVKLAVAIGALLGAQLGLFAISASAAGAALMTLGARILRRGKQHADDRAHPALAPYGAALAITSAVFLVGRLMLRIA